MGRRTTHPQAAYFTFVVGYNQKFNYVFWMMKDLNKFPTPQKLFDPALYPLSAIGGAVMIWSYVSWLCQSNMEDLV